MVLDLSKLNILLLWSQNPMESPLLGELRFAFEQLGLPTVSDLDFPSQPEVVVTTLSLHTPQPTARSRM